MKEEINKIIKQDRRSIISETADRLGPRMQQANKRKSLANPAPDYTGSNVRCGESNELESVAGICRSLITVVICMDGRSYTG